ncbi:hypothetical protein [Neisseria sp.]|uniref:hypothetical protein n=1 Tax=Neisseria sp. TaxID=192066 RepID=UPI0035A1A5BC
MLSPYGLKTAFRHAETESKVGKQRIIAVLGMQGKRCRQLFSEKIWLSQGRISQDILIPMFILQPTG